MRIPEVSTSLPLLAPGEPPYPHIAYITPSAREAMLAASAGQLRRCGVGWFGLDKRRPFHRRTILALIKRGLLFRNDLNCARTTRTGRWCARTICSEIAGNMSTTKMTGEACNTTDS